MKRFQIAAALVGILLLVFIGLALYRLISSPSPATTPATSNNSVQSIQESQITCEQTTIEQYLADLDALVIQWDDALKLAASTSRGAISPVVDTMQRIRRDAMALESPQCTVHLQELLVMSMNDAIDGILAFMQEEPDYVSDGFIDDAQLSRSIFHSHRSLFEIAPQEAYLVASTAITIVAPFVFSDQWFNVRLIQDERPIFSLPHGWEVYPSNSWSRVAIRDSAAAIQLTIEKDKPTAFLFDATPPVALAHVASEYAVVETDSELTETTYGNFGNNLGFLIASNGLGTFQIGGAIRTPESTYYWFNATKRDAPFTADEELLIKQIISSLRLAT